MSAGFSLYLEKLNAEKLLNGISGLMQEGGKQ
jgi:hypothetical protein